MEFDLPIHVTELILEKLPLIYYIRFGAVCTKWQSIQKNHRLRHSPSPPPMQTSPPWLIQIVDNQLPKSVNCHSSADFKPFHLQFPEHLIAYCFTSYYGWLMMLRYREPWLLNPATNSRINLPDLRDRISNQVRLTLSSPPLNPDCFAFIVDSCIYRISIRLCRLHEKQCDWTPLSLPDREVTGDNGHLRYGWVGAVYCNGKFYFLLEMYSRCIFSVDPTTETPSVDVSGMDSRNIQMQNLISSYLVEFNGDIMVVVAYHHQASLVRTFEVFKADLLNKIWVNMEGQLENLVFFISARGSLCMLASDADCKGNCLFGLESGSVFDLETKSWTKSGHAFISLGASFHSDSNSGLWLVPSL